MLLMMIRVMMMAFDDCRGGVGILTIIIIIMVMVVIRVMYMMTVAMGLDICVLQIHILRP